MTIKQLFKKVETANEIGRLFDEKYGINLYADHGCRIRSFFTYREFKSYIKETYNTPWAKELLKDFEMDNGLHEGEFVCCFNIKDEKWGIEEIYIVEFDLIKVN